MRLNAWAARLLRFVVRLVQRLTGGTASRSHVVSPLTANEAAGSGAPAHWLKRARSAGPPAHWLDRIRWAREASGALETFDQTTPLPVDLPASFQPPDKSLADAPTADNYSPLARQVQPAAPSANEPSVSAASRNPFAIGRPEEASAGVETIPAERQSPASAAALQCNSSVQPLAVPLRVRAESAIAGIRAAMRALLSVPRDEQRSGMPTPLPARTTHAPLSHTTLARDTLGRNLHALPGPAEVARRTAHLEFPQEAIGEVRPPDTEIRIDTGPHYRSDRVRIPPTQNISLRETAHLPSLPVDVGDKARASANQNAAPLTIDQAERSLAHRSNRTRTRTTSDARTSEIAPTSLHLNWPEPEAGISQAKLFLAPDETDTPDPIRNFPPQPDPVEFVGRWPDLPAQDIPKPHDGTARSQREQQHLQRLVEEQQRL